MKNVLRRLRAAGHGMKAAPLFVFDAGYSAATLTDRLLGCPAHVLIRLAAGSVFYADPVTTAAKVRASEQPGPLGPAPHGRGRPAPPRPVPWPPASAAPGRNSPIPPGRWPRDGPAGTSAGPRKFLRGSRAGFHGGHAAAGRALDAAGPAATQSWWRAR